MKMGWNVLVGLLAYASLAVASANTVTTIGNPTISVSACAPNTECIQGLLGDQSTWSASQAFRFADSNDINDIESAFQLQRETSAMTKSLATSAQYFSLTRSDQWTAFFQNVSGGQITLDVNGPGENYTITEYSVIPIPAAAWLFGSAVLALLGFGYRRKSALKQSHGVEAVPA